MAKIVYSAYNRYDTNSNFRPITADYAPYDNSSTGWTKLLYLPSGITIARGGAVQLYACEDITSAELPDGKFSKLGINFANAQDVTVTNGGVLELTAGAVASNTVISGSSSTEKVNFYWTFKQNNPEANPAIGASSFNAVIQDGGTQDIKGGYACNTIISSGGTQEIAKGEVRKFIRDDDNEWIQLSSSADGIAENTNILEGGIQYVSAGGIAYNTQINGGQMTVSRGGTAVNTHLNSGSLNVSGTTAVIDTLYISQNAQLSISTGTVEGLLFATNAENISISKNAKTDELDFCFDLTNMTDRTITVLDADLYGSLNEKTSFFISNDLTKNIPVGENGEKTFTYSIISGIENFNKSITVLNSRMDSNGNKNYTAGSTLSFENEVYDIFGNSYILVRDAENNISVDFTINSIFSDIAFTDNYYGMGEFFAAENKQSGLYSIYLDILDMDEPLTKSERLAIFQSLNGTVNVYDNNVLIGTQKIENGIVVGEKILSGPVSSDRLRYTIELSTDGSVDKDFTIRATLTNTALGKADTQDNSWQALPEVSKEYSDKHYIYRFYETNTAEITNEYVGFDDNVDYRRFDVSRAGTLDINGEAFSLNNAEGTLSITVYQADKDGSALKKIAAASGKIIDSKINFSDILINEGIYYLEVKSDDASFVNYDLNVSVNLFDFKDASNLDDTAVKAAEYFDSIKFEETVKDKWVGPGDIIDYQLLDITETGKYTITLDKNIAEDELNNSKIKLEVVEIYNGKQKVLSNQTIKTDVTNYTTKDFYISPVDGAQYFVRITNTTAAKGDSIFYDITLNGTTFNANTADDLPENAAAAEKITDKNSYLVKNEYIGYGDLTDYYTFEIDKSGMYSFTLESSIKAGAKATIYRLYDDGKIGTVPLQSVVSVGAPNIFAADSEIYSAQGKSVALMEGTYYIKITGGNKSNDSKNADYSVKLSGTAFENLADTQEIRRGTTYTITLDDYTDLSSDLYKYFSITQDNGKNKTVKIPSAQKITLAVGTYYFTSKIDMKSADISFAASEKYAEAVITDNNSWKNASDISAEGVSDQWVGFGDGIDYYKYTVTADTAGKNVITLAPHYAANANITLYRVNTDAKGVQTLVKASYKFKNNVITADNLTAGDYYIAVNSKSYTTETKALNTSYDIAIETDAYQKLSSDIANKTVLAKNEYAVVNIGQEGTFYASFSGEKYTLFKDNGKGGFAKVNVYDNTAMLDGNSVYYVKSSADGNKIAFTSTTVEDNKYDTPNSRWHLGLNDASDSYEFDTFGEQGGMALFTLENISDTVSANTKFTVTVYQEVNGAWKKISSANASYNAKTCKETAAKLAVSLEADNKYKVEVSTSDKGAGQCAGYFDFKETDFDYNYDNNMFQQATELKNYMDAVVAKKGDTVDFYELDNTNAFSIEINTDIDAKAAVKLTFYDENYKVVKFDNNGKSVSNLTINAKNGFFDMANISEDIKFARIDAVGSGVNYYTISDSID